MNKTQDHLNIAEIKDDLIFLKDGGAALVLQTSAVNFGLLSELEQVAIIDTFAQMLNSLSFSIQVVIRSTRLDISSYLELLDSAQRLQVNPLLSEMMIRYKSFIQSTIKENEVLDKKFYIVISIASYELGLVISDMENRLKKSKILLLPRRDQLLRQLSRVGLKATQLNTTELIKLFFDIYNRQIEGQQPNSINIEPVKLATPLPIRENQPPPIFNPQPQSVSQTSSPLKTPLAAKNHPFVVEELSDNV